MNHRVKNAGERILNFLRSPLGFFCVSLAVCAASQATLMTTETAETTIKDVGKLFTGTGFKVGLAIATVIGTVVASHKGAIGKAVIVFGIGLGGSVWLSKITAGL